MAFRKALAVLAVVLVLALPSQDIVAAEASAASLDPTEIATTKDVDDGGIIVSVIAIVIGTFLAWAGAGGKNVVAGPVSVDVDTTHLHVSDTRSVVVDFPFSNGNINVWDHSGWVYVTITVDGVYAVSKVYSLSGAVQNISRHTIPIEAGSVGTTSINVTASVRGEDHGLFVDTRVSRTSVGSKQIGVLSPVGPLSLSPPPGETFAHGLGVMHSLMLENHAAKEVWVTQGNVNGTTQSTAIAVPGQDHGPSATTQLMFGAVNHTAGHTTATVPVGFVWGCSEFAMPLTGRMWKQSSMLTSSTDFCQLKGDSEPSPLVATTIGELPSVSSGCFTPGFVQLSDVPHNFSPGGITVSLVNHPGVGPVHDLTTDVTGQFCWDALPLAEFVDIYVNSDGNIPEIAQQVYERIPLASLEGGPPTLELNYVEWLVPPVIGTLEASDGDDLYAVVYSRRPGFPDHPVGLVSNGAFTLGGRAMLEFNSYSSELVFVPEPPFNRTLAPATPIVVPFDPTLTDGPGLGTISFNIAPREPSPNIVVRGTFFNEDLSPIPGLEIEFHNGPTLITSGLTNAAGFFEVTVPNGVATVSAPSLEALDLEPLPPEVVDFGLNGMTILDIGNRMLFRDPALFFDGFESGDTSEWASVMP